MFGLLTAAGLGKINPATAKEVSGVIHQVSIRYLGPQSDIGQRSDQV